MMEDNVSVAPAGASEGEVLTEMFREAGEAPAAPERDIQLITAEIQFFKRQAGQAVYEIGRCLLEAKAQLKHGEWLPWLRDEVAFSEASAQRYMRLAREYGKSRIVTDLGAGKALELLALPESQREEFVEENDVSGMTREQLRQAIREELKAAKAQTETARGQLHLAREEAEKARKLAAASQDEGLVRFKLLFADAQGTVNRMAEELEQAPEESRDKLRRAMLALADAIRKAVGE